MTWRIADQLVCFERFLVYSDLKYDPLRRPREMRIMDPRHCLEAKAPEIFRTGQGRAREAEALCEAEHAHWDRSLSS